MPAPRIPSPAARAAPSGLKAFGFFLMFASAMLALAGTVLLFPGTALDGLWVLNPRAHEKAALGEWIGAAFFFLSALLGYTARLWFQRRFLGWRLAVIIVALQAMGDAFSFIRGELVGGLIGLAIASGLLGYLRSRRVKAAFH